MKNKITVLITGPIDNRTYESIDSYREQGFEQIIVSTWDDEDISLLNKTSKNYKLILSSYPSNLDKINNQGCRFYQSYLTWKGCKAATKPFTIRTRSDEIYPDLSKFVDNLSEHPNRVHTTDNGFWKIHPACFSTHLFGGKTDTIKEGCKLMVLHSEGQFMNGAKINYPEQCFGAFFMLVLGFNIFNSDWKKVFYENVFITPCSDLPDHLHSGQTLTDFNFKRVPNYPNNRPDSKIIAHTKESMYRNYNEFIT